MVLAIIIIGAIIIAINVYVKVKEKPEPIKLEPATPTQEPEKSDDTPAKVQENDQEQAETEDISELLISTLKSMGCNPKRDENGDIDVKYQGENFHIECFNHFVNIWDPAWASFNLADPKAVPTQQAVNDANFNPGPTIVMTTPNSEGEVLIHSHWTIVFHPALPDKDKYLGIVFSTFFEAKSNLVKSRNEILEKVTKIAQN